MSNELYCFFFSANKRFPAYWDSSWNARYAHIRPVDMGSDRPTLHNYTLLEIRGICEAFIIFAFTHLCPETVQVVSASDYGSRGPGFEARWNQNYPHDCMLLY